MVTSVACSAVSPGPADQLIIGNGKHTSLPLPVPAVSDNRLAPTQGLSSSETLESKLIPLATGQLCTQSSSGSSVYIPQNIFNKSMSTDMVFRA